MDVTDQSFQADVIERSKQEPVVVDFWAEWCGPCRMLGPVLETETAAAGVTLAKVDVDANQEVARTYGISGIPAVKAFRNGEVVDEFVGALPPARVRSFLEKLTEPPPPPKPLVAETIDDPEVAPKLQAGDYESALQILLDRAIAARTPEERDPPRLLMLEIFDELGLEDPIATTYRKRLAAALY